MVDSIASLSRYETWLFILGAYVILQYLWTATGLRQFPGPRLAKFSRLWIFFKAATVSGYKLYPSLHRKYGPIVRLGPKQLSVSDPRLVPLLYANNVRWDKSSWYDAWTLNWRGKWMESVFTIRRSERHDKTRARIARGYTASYLRSGEPLIDQCTEMFIRAMDDLVNTPVDLGEWVQWYAFDVIGLVNFGNTFGFMETRRDPYKIIQNLDNTTEVGTALGYLPEIHWTLQRLTLGPKGKGILDLPPFADANPIPVIMDMVTTAMARYPEHTDEKRADFLAFMRSEQAKRPERLSDFDIISHLTSNCLAGHDTTGIVLRSVFYFLINNPPAYARLQAEIDEHAAKGQFSRVIQFQEVQEMPYLHAVLKEALRVHPAFTTPMYRTVPPSGLVLPDGEFVPAGTEIGISQWVLHFDQDIFGEDAADFRPERWLESSPEVLARREANFAGFGLGRRTCIGRQLAMFQLSKLVPEVLRRYRVKWAGDEKGWQVGGGVFAKQRGVVVQMEQRA